MKVILLQQVHFSPQNTGTAEKKIHLVLTAKAASRYTLEAEGVILLVITMYNIGLYDSYLTLEC